MKIHSKDTSDTIIEYDAPLFKVPSKFGYRELTEGEIMKIAQIINDNIFTTYPSLNNIYKYLTKVAKIMNMLNIPVSWITPCGLRLTQKYASIKKKPIKISISFLGKKTTSVLRE